MVLVLADEGAEGTDAEFEVGHLVKTWQMCRCVGVCIYEKGKQSS